MKGKNNLVEMKKALGKQNYLIRETDYIGTIKQSPLIEGLWTVGNWFAFVSNTHTWDLELVSGNSIEMTGYSHEEIMQMNSKFVTELIYHEDFSFVNRSIQEAMKYVATVPGDQKQHIYLNFYMRLVRSDGSVFYGQNQNIPLIFDERNIPYVFINIITDITHLTPGKIPHAVLVNKKTNELFHLDEKSFSLKARESKFSAREIEIIRLLIRGKSSRQIGDRLFISHETVRTHRKNILQKAEVNSTAELISDLLLSKVI